MTNSLNNKMTFMWVGYSDILIAEDINFFCNEPKDKYFRLINNTVLCKVAHHSAVQVSSQTATDSRLRNSDRSQ